MNGDSLLLLGDFNAYANQQVLAVAAQLSADQFVQEASPSHGMVRKLLIYMLGGERYFLAACQGSEFKPEEFETLSTWRRSASTGSAWRVRRTSSSPG